MTTMSIDLRMRSRIELHPRRIRTAFDPVKKRALYKMSAFVQRRMKSSIKKRKKAPPARRGQPPIARASKKPNLRTIVFEVDVADESAIIGPIEFRGRHTDKPAPQTLEHGGTATQELADGSKRRVKIHPHPFAEPALAAEIGKFPELLRG